MCEVADTQSRKKLKKRIQEYIIGTEGIVKIVILIKLERDKPQPKRKRDVNDDDHDDDPGIQLDGPAEPGHVGGDRPREPEADNETESTEPECIGESAEADNAEEPVLPDGPPSRPSYSRGVFWVYSHEYDPDRGANHARIKCLENEQVTQLLPSPPLV